MASHGGVARETRTTLPRPGMARPAVLALAAILLAIPRSTSHLGPIPTTGLGGCSPAAPLTPRVSEVSERVLRLHRLHGGGRETSGEADGSGVGRSAEVLARKKNRQLHMFNISPRSSAWRQWRDGSVLELVGVN